MSSFHFNEVKNGVDVCLKFLLAVGPHKNTTEHLQEDAGVLHSVALMVVLKQTIDIRQLSHVVYSPDGMDMPVFQTDAEGGILRGER